MRECREPRPDGTVLHIYIAIAAFSIENSTKMRSNHARNDPTATLDPRFFLVDCVWLFKMMGLYAENDGLYTQE